jgi:hypothetical protein
MFGFRVGLGKWMASLHRLSRQPFWKPQVTWSVENNSTLGSDLHNGRDKGQSKPALEEKSGWVISLHLSGIRRTPPSVPPLSSRICGVSQEDSVIMSPVSGWGLELYEMGGHWL